MGILFALAAFALPAAASAAQPSGPARALERRLGPQAVLDVNAETGTPRMLARLDGTLSGPADGSPEAVALRYVRAHLDALGLSERDLSSLGRPSVADSGDVSSVRWPQSVDGIEAADRELRVNVTADGRVLSVLGSPAPDLDVDTSPGLDAGDAVRAVQDLVGVHRPLTRSGTPSGAERTTRYSDGTTAELAVFRDRLSWRVTYRSASDEVWDAFVDAETGRVLRRVNMVKSAAPALVWERYPGAPTGGTQAPVDLEARGYLAAGANTLDGPNVRAFSDLNDNDALDSGEEVSRSGGSFAFAFNSFPGPTCGPAAQCSWDPAIAFSWSANRQQNAVQAFYFANQFHDHLRQPPISFTDRPFEGGDELELHTDDGANTAGGLPDDDHVNNANMLTPPDGQSPVMQMYLWEPPSFRGANSGDDAGVLYHEYAHGLSTRLVTDAAGVGALNSAQAGAMGEGISDFYAQDYLVERFGGDTATPAQIDMGAYLDAPGRPHSLRSEALDCPVGAPATACPGSPTAGSGGYTYGDFAQILGANRPEVHFDGEIWAQTLWDLRGALGVAEARRAITQGMRLSPPEPSFLDMRNAILLAAASEAQRQAMWSVFAARGMGYYASTTGGDDVGPLQDFSVPPSPGEPRGRVAGRITDAATGQGLAGATAVVGGSFDLGAAAGADGSYSVGGMPARAYQNFIFTAAGYDRQIGSALVGAAATTPLNPTLRRNWAARSGGGIAEGVTLFPGCGLNEAIDQSQATTWSTTAAQNRMVIRLPAAATVTWLSADPGEGCGDDFTSATRQLRIETSVSDTANDWVPVGGTNTAGGVHTFTFADRHRLNDIPITARAGVRRVRVTLLDNFGGPYGDLSEFGVHSIARPSFPVGAPVPDPTPQPSPPTPAPPSPGPPAPGPAPPAPPRPPSPPAAPSISLPATGKRSVRFGVTCAVSCRVSARLTVDRRTARRLRLGRSRTAGSLSSRTVGAGRQTVTLRLASRAARALKQRRVRSFRARVSATAAYPGARPVSRSRQLTIRR